MNKVYQVIIILLILVGGSACASTDSHNRASDDEDKDIGLGGTGLLANSGSGLGGTGIVGKITGYGSIFVNGVEVEYDSKTPITVNGKTGISRQLDLGDIVEVLTIDAKKHSQALMINVRHEIVGRVDSVNQDNFSFNVQGQTVIHAINMGRMPNIGDRVAISGFRIDKETILSTKVAPANDKKNLVRKYNELPFSNKTSRWLIQAYVKDGKTSFQLDGASYAHALSDKETESLMNRSGVGIIQLHKTGTDELKLDQVIDAGSIPMGRQTRKPAQHFDGNTGQKLIPGMMSPASPGSMPPNMRPEVNRRNQ